MIPFTIKYDSISSFLIVTGAILEHTMPDVAAVVTTGLGVSVLAGVLSGVCYIIVNGFGSGRSSRQKKRWYCQICGTRLNTTKHILDDSIVTCFKCGSRVCKEKCARYIQRGDWICQKCLLPERSWFQELLRTIRCSTNYFEDPFDTIMDDAKANTNFESLKELEKVEVRDFIEKIVNVMLGENVDSASISMLYNDKQYLPALGQSPCTAHAALKEIIEKLSKQAVNLPLLEKAHAQTSIDEENKNKTYEDLLATAIINKVVDSCQNNLPGSSRNSVSSRLSASSRYKDDKEYFFSEETLYNKWKTTDLDSTSGSSLDDWAHSESSFGSRKYAEKVTLTINQNIEEVDNLESDVENENDENVLKNDAEYFRSTSSLFTDSETNWLLQRRSFHGTPSPVPVPMLVPNPTIEAKVLIGDKPLDDTSDLSDIGSDFEDICPTQTTYSLLVQSKNIIGGGSSLQLVENGDERSESSTDSGVKEVNGREEKSTDSVKSNKADITVDDDNVEDSSYVSVCSNSEKVAEYTERYASLPRQILKETSTTTSIKEKFRNLGDDSREQELDDQHHSYSDTEFVGNYSKKEKEKWNHAVELKNNPYSKENIERRLHRSGSSASSIKSTECVKLAKLPSGGSERVSRISLNWTTSDSTRENSPTSPPSADLLQNKRFISGEQSHDQIKTVVRTVVKKGSSAPPPISSNPPPVHLLQNPSYIARQSFNGEVKGVASTDVEKKSYISKQIILGQANKEESTLVKTDSAIPPPISSAPPPIDLLQQSSYISRQSFLGRANNVSSTVVETDLAIPPPISSGPPPIDLLKKQSYVSRESFLGQSNNASSTVVEKDSAIPPPISSGPPPIDLLKKQSYISGQYFLGQANNASSTVVERDSAIPPPISSAPPPIDLVKKQSYISRESFLGQANNASSTVVATDSAISPPVSSTPPPLDLLKKQSYLSRQSFLRQVSNAEPVVVIPETDMNTISSHVSVSSPVKSSNLHKYASESYSPEITSDSDLSYVNSYDVEHSQVIKETRDGSLHIPIRSAPLGLSYKSFSDEINNNKEPDNYVVITHTTEENTSFPKPAPIARQRTFINHSRTNNETNSHTSDHHLVRQTSENNLLEDSFDAPPKVLSQKRDNTLISKIYKDPKVRLFAMKSRDDSVGEQLQYQSQRSLELIDTSEKNDHYYHTNNKERAYQSSDDGLSSDYESGKTGKMSFFSSEEDLLSNYSDVSTVHNNVTSHGKITADGNYYARSNQNTPKLALSKKFIYSSQENLLGGDEVGTLPKKKDNTLINKIYSDPRVLNFALKTHANNMPNLEALTPTPTPKTNFPNTDDTYFFSQSTRIKASDNQKLYKSYDDLSSENISLEHNHQPDTQQLSEKIQDGYNSEDIDIEEINKKHLVRNALGRFSKSEVHIRTVVERAPPEHSFTQDDDEIWVSVRDLRKKFENNDKHSHQVVSSLTARSLSKKVKDILKL